MSGSLRILYYNWVDYLDDEGRGGGVSVYQRNLMAGLAARGDTEAVFLSAGLSHDLRRGPPRWERLRHGPTKDRERRYEIVNSGVLAPAHHGFGDPAQLEHPETEAAFYDFIDATGPYDVVHFNNLEGLPVSVLACKKRWPQMRIILSLHNYYPFCSQVNLWHQERENCTDFDAGRKCVHCLPQRHDARLLRLAGGLAYRLKRAGLRPGSWAFDVAFRWTLRIGGRSARALKWLRGMTNGNGVVVDAPGRLHPLHAPDGSGFVARRAGMVAQINRYCDRVLCVSDAVRHLAVHHGISPPLAQTSYIGTRESEAFAHTAPHPDMLAATPRTAAQPLTLGYLGYMRRDKGFYFLLQALESLPAPLAALIGVVIAARRGDKATMARIADLSTRLAGVQYADGYGHSDLDGLLAEVDVGVIPVLWHDNLPQVAIEMHARHIPLLCADMGGAKELGRCPDMVFAAGDIDAFHDRLAALVEGRIDMQSYWQGARTPVGITAHLDALMGHYLG